MTADSLFVQGGLKVLDHAGDTVGFAWIGSAAPTGTYLQRWVLKRLFSGGVGTAFRFGHWEHAPENLGEWLEAVQVPFSGGSEWGDDPLEHGLWPHQLGAFYVVAQSIRAQFLEPPLGLQIPEPVYPRADVVAGLRAKLPLGRRAAPVASRSRKAPARGKNPRPGGPPVITGIPRPCKPGECSQTIVPYMELRRSIALAPGAPVDVGIGGGHVDAFEGQMFFTGEERFLLKSGYHAVGAAGVEMRWEESSDNTFEDLTRDIRAWATTDDRVEVIGCNYYQDTDPADIRPPPEEFL